MKDVGGAGEETTRRGSGVSEVGKRFGSAEPASSEGPHCQHLRDMSEESLRTYSR